MIDVLFDVCGVIGSEGYFRLSFATDIDTIRNGISRIAEFVKELKK